MLLATNSSTAAQQHKLAAGYCQHPPAQHHKTSHSLHLLEQPARTGGRCQRLQLLTSAVNVYRRSTTRAVCSVCWESLPRQTTSWLWLLRFTAWTAAHLT
jgi:hypothetical protein